MLKSLSTSELRVHGYNRYQHYVQEKRYEIMEQIGKGGNGVILATKDLTNDKIYVCKSIPKTNTRVKQELASMIRINGAIKVHDYYEDDKNYYIIMDKGWKDLHSTHIEHYQPVEEKEVQRIIVAVLKTLAKSHSKGIIHLDIKAGNLLWLDEMQKKLALIDWGLSMKMESDNDKVVMPECSGTPWFMAPEQLSSEASNKSDIWAVGVLTAQLLTKKLPFNDHRNTYTPSVSAIWRSILMDTLNTNTSSWKNISNEAKHFVNWLLSKDPKERPTAIECLEHPWLSKMTKEIEYNTDEKRKAREERFNTLDYIQRECLKRLATKLNLDVVYLSSTFGNEIRKAHNTRAELYKVFEELDKDNDGYISIDDIDIIDYENKNIYEIIKENLTEWKKIDYRAFEKFVLKDPELPLYVFA